MVEFALLAPVAFLLLLGTIVTGLVVVDQVSLSNAVRDVARAAAVCGGNGGPRDPHTQLPGSNGLPAQVCSWPNLQAYARARLGSLLGGGRLSPPAGNFPANCQAAGVVEVCLWKADGTTGVPTGSSNPLDLCVKGDQIEISGQYAQPLYLPLVGRWLGSGGSDSTRTLSADARATCEQ